MDDELSDGQCQKLLEIAQQRLRSTSDHSNSPPNKTEGQMQPHPHLSLALNCSLPSNIKRTSEGTRFSPNLLVSNGERDPVACIRPIEVQVPAKFNIEKVKKTTAGPNWYNMPKTNLTPELKRDLQLIRLRSVLDPKRHYKKDGNRNQFPEFSQVGTIIEGPTEFFSARIPNKDRKTTFVGDILATETSTNQYKFMYNNIQKAKVSGKMAHYKKVKSRRKGRPSNI